MGSALCLLALKIFICFLFRCISFCLCTMCSQCLQSPEKNINPQELELQIVVIPGATMWTLGIELKSFARATVLLTNKLSLYDH